MIDQQTIDAMAERLLSAAPSGSRVILFGSYAKGTATEDSDLDFLVVEPEVANRYAESGRLRRVLLDSEVPVDIHVISSEQFDYWKDTPITLYFDAAKEGQPYGPNA